MTADATPSRDQADLLSRVGEWLYGDYFVVPLANALTVSERTMRRWLGAQAAIPGGIWGDLAAVIDDRRRAIDAADWILHRQMLDVTVERDISDDVPF